MSNFIIGQIISTAALVVSVLIAQFKNVKYILIGEIAANLLVAFSFLFLGGMSGAWICIVAAVQAIIIFYANEKNIEQRIRNILTLIFAAVYIIGTIAVYQNWCDIVSCTCAMLYILAITQEASSKYRIYMGLNSLLWVIYDISTQAYVNVITHGMLLVSLAIAMVRLDRERRSNR